MMEPLAVKRNETLTCVVTAESCQGIEGMGDY